MINLTTISDNIQTILESIQETKTLPNLPNIKGILNETTIVHVVSSGEYETPNLINLDLKVSLASEYREESEDESRKSINELISLIISVLHNRSLPQCKKIRFKKFEIFTPESGKWRSLLEFTIPMMLSIANDLEDNSGIINEVIFGYAHRCP
jgi:hypothetical protein